MTQELETRSAWRILPDVQVTISFDANDVYDASTSPTRNVSPWIRALNDVLDTGALEIVADDPERGGEIIKKILTPESICRSFAELVTRGTTHCNGYPLADLDNSDACTSDLVLQFATYGDVIWG